MRKKIVTIWIITVLFLTSFSVFVVADEKNSLNQVMVKYSFEMPVITDVYIDGYIYDRLIMEIWTNGTIRPEEALGEAARVLVEHLLLVAGAEEEISEEGAEEEGVPTHVYEMLIEDLDLNVRVYNCLKRTGITNVGEVLERLEKGEEAMMGIRNFGPKSLVELKQKLEERGFLLTVEEESEE